MALMEQLGYCELKEETLDRTVWRTGFESGCGSVVRQTAESMTNPIDIFHSPSISSSPYAKLTLNMRVVNSSETSNNDPLAPEFSLKF